MSSYRRAGSVALARGDVQQHLAALAWLDVQALQGREHLALPTDLFVVSVCGAAPEPGLGSGPASTGELQVVVSMLRTRPARCEVAAGEPGAGADRLLLALLTPAGLIRVLRAPLDGLTDRRLPLAHFCGLAEERRLREALLGAVDVHERLRRLGHWVESRAQQRQGLRAAQRRTARAAGLLLQPGAAVGLPALARQLGVTQRQLERDFRRWLGVSPALYARVVRFQRAAALVCAGGRFLDAVFEHGYADQSHLNRSFKALSGLTPGELAALASPPHRADERAALAGRVWMVDAPTRRT
jgi:AraC-like DNA-binding protein